MFSRLLAVQFICYELEWMLGILTAQITCLLLITSLNIPVGLLRFKRVALEIFASVSTIAANLY